MRISELATLLSLTPKETMAEVEGLRDDLTKQGFKLAKKLTAASGIDENAVRLIMVAVDGRRKQTRQAEQAEEDARLKAEEEARRKAEDEKRQAEMEERRKAAEEARRKADEALERRRAQLAQIDAATPAAAAPPVAPPSVVPQGRNEPQSPAAPPQAAAAAPAAPRQARPDDRGPRRDDRPPARGGDAGGRGKGEKGSRPASAANLGRFVDKGLEPKIVEDRPARRRPEDKTRRGPAGGGRGDAKPAPPRDKNRKSVGPTRIFRGEEVARRSAPRPERAKKGRGGGRSRDSRPSIPKLVTLHGDFTVGEFADKCRIPVADVQRRLFDMGEMKTINQLLEAETAELIAADFGIEVIIRREGDEFDVEEFMQAEDKPESLRQRPPIVTIMGHVDHGKTTLLDRIRDANVADGEAGGITQHIGAYYVTTAKGDIVFLDTPGHEAFTAMRARGAGCTDLVVLVVAANDGVMPQTVEAISHARAANVPMIVAVNKTDVEGANPERVKQELMRYEIVGEEYGGETIMVNISAKTGDNVQNLLEMIALQAEVLELQANPDRPAMGIIVESHVDKTRGAVATVLVQEGTLKVGDHFLCGAEYGRVRAMMDDRGASLQEAGPARPVEILGLTGSPQAGEQFLVLKSEADAREIAERRAHRRKNRAAVVKSHVSLDNLKERIEEGEIKTLNLVIKGDVQGSVEAIVGSLLKIESDKVLIRILHQGAGAVTESDVQLADASDAIILGFNVRPDPATRDLAEELGVQVKLYSIIYDLIENIKSAMLGMVDRETEEIETGRAVVKKIYRVSKVGNIAGCFVEEGTIGVTHKARIVRGGAVVWKGALKTLRRVKDDAKEVQSGLECGIGLQNFNDIKEDDVIETYTLRELEATLVSAPAGDKPDTNGGE